MTTTDDTTKTADQIRLLRTIRIETATCAVLDSADARPDALAETVCALVNCGGGMLILGISAKDDFRPVRSFDAQSACCRLESVVSSVTPAVSVAPKIVVFEGCEIVTAEVPSVASKEMPCFITGKGPYAGAFIRTGSGTRALTDYEVNLLLSERSQPRFDAEPVEQASSDDLDPQLLEAFIRQQKRTAPWLAALSGRDILLKTGVLVKIRGKLRPTLAGFIAAGHFPQQFFPRLNVTLTIWKGASSQRRLALCRPPVTTQTFNGPISEMLRQSMVFLRQHMRVAGRIEGSVREDIPEYPPQAFRELLVNALEHRDYSPQARATSVKVNLFDDCLEVVSPGGLYGAASVSEFRLGINCLRNLTLARLLESLPNKDAAGSGACIASNKNTGIMRVRELTQAAGTAPAKFEHCVSTFCAVLPKRTLAAQKTGLLRGPEIDLVILRLLSEGPLSVQQLTRYTGLNRRTITGHLSSLTEDGCVERTQPENSPKQRYRLADHPHVPKQPALESAGFPDSVQAFPQQTKLLRARLPGRPLHHRNI